MAEPEEILALFAVKVVMGGHLQGRAVKPGQRGQLVPQQGGSFFQGVRPGGEGQALRQPDMAADEIFHTHPSAVGHMRGEEAAGRAGFRAVALIIGDLSPQGGGDILGKAELFLLAGDGIFVYRQLFNPVRIVQGGVDARHLLQVMYHKEATGVIRTAHAHVHRGGPGDFLQGLGGGIAWVLTDRAAGEGAGRGAGEPAPDQSGGNHQGGAGGQDGERPASGRAGGGGFHGCQGAFPPGRPGREGGQGLPVKFSVGHGQIPPSADRAAVSWPA